MPTVQSGLFPDPGRLEQIADAHLGNIAGLASMAVAKLSPFGWFGGGAEGGGAEEEAAAAVPVAEAVAEAVPAAEAEAVPVLEAEAEAEVAEGGEVEEAEGSGVRPAAGSPVPAAAATQQGASEEEMVRELVSAMPMATLAAATPSAAT